MTTSPSEYLNRVFPRRFLFRGAALQSLVWSVLGTVSLAALLLLILMLFLLIETQGRVDLTAEQAAGFHALFGDSPGVPEASLEAGWDVAPADAGLRAAAWKLRTRPMGRVVAWVCRTSPEFYGTGSAFLTLLAAGFGFSLAALCFLELARRSADRCAKHTGRQLRESLHRHSLRMGTSDLSDRQVADVLALFTTEVESVQRWIAAFICRIVQAPLQLVLLIVIGAMVDWLFLIECGVPLLAVWLFVLHRRRQHCQKVQLEDDRASTELKLVGEGIRRSRLIRGFLLDAFEHVRFERHLDRYDSHLAMAEKQHRRMFLVSALAVITGVCIVLYIAGGRVLTETEYALSVSEVVFLCGSLLLTSVPLTSLLGLLAMRDAARTSIDRVYRYLNTIPEVGQAVGAEFLQPLEKVIEFHDVGYSAGGRQLLGGISLRIPAGGVTALVAFDRIEATTLAAMLPRFVDPSEGYATIDGHDVAQATLESLRSEVLWAGGPNSWFTGSVLENIAGGDERFSLSQVTEAAKRTHAHSFIQKYAQGYETIVGEHGEQLSDSQGFRLSLARALLRDPAVLIIEEPVQVDSADEKALLEDAFRNAARGRTVIVLPARLRTLKAADRIVLLTRGRVEVVGTHEALLQSSSLYRHWEYLHFNEFRSEVVTAD